MRLLLLKFAYPQYLSQYYRHRPEVAHQTYREQKAELDRDAFWWGDSWARALEPLGHRVTEVVMNAEPLQRAWARENGVAVARLDWMLPVILGQVRHVRPEGLFIQSFRGLHYDSLRRIQEAAGTIRRTVGWCGAPPLDLHVFRACDVMLSCVPEIVAELSRLGHRSYHLHHAFDPRVLERLDTHRGKSIDLSFVGNVTSQEMYGERVSLLQRIERELPLSVYTFLGGTPIARLAKTVAGKALYPLAQRLVRAGVDRSVVQALPLMGRTATWAGSPRYRRAFIPPGSLRPPVYGLEMFQTLRDSKVTLNIHRAISRGSASNLRLFEASGVGTCQLTDWKPNLADLFRVDEEVVAYRTPEECVDKARWLLEHSVERERIAQAGQERTLREHTFAHRAPDLDRILRAT